MIENPQKERYPGVSKERLGVEVTTHCNINCPHCFARAGISDFSSLSLSLVKAIVADGYDVGYRHLHITGGEPLLWEGLFEAFDYAFAMGFQTVFLNTNGTLLTKYLSSRLATYEGLSLSISLEGSKSLHDRLRGNGSYMQTIQGIGHALDRGIDLSIFTTACKSLLPVLSWFAHDLYNKFPDIAYLTLIQLISPTNGNFTLSDELLDPEDFLQIIDKVSILNLLGQRTRFLNNPLAYVASKRLKLFWIPPSAPLYSNGSMIIMANRDICLSHSSTNNFGKYEMGMIDKILASHEYRKAVAPNETECPTCRYSSLCRENGMTHPVEGYRGNPSDDLYCQEVLGSVVR